MDNGTVRQTFDQVVSRCGGYIQYSPLGNEVDARDLGLFRFGMRTVTLPKNANADPHDWARQCVGYCGSLSVCIFVPGRMFDMQGTRHGRGNGWYDRFLSQVPRSWIRIGVGTVREFSAEPITRAAWDEPMDWVAIKDASSWRVYETRARHF